MTGTQLSYYFLCQRKLWLYSYSIQMEQHSDAVTIGRMISSSTYTRKKHEVHIDNIVLDFYDEQTQTVHEVKKSSAMEEVHLWQVKHYLYTLERKGITNVRGKLHYPLLKQTSMVSLSDEDRTRLEQISTEITGILALSAPPPTIDKPFCKRCSYYELCYV